MDSAASSARYSIICATSPPCIIHPKPIAKVEHVKMTKLIVKVPVVSPVANRALDGYLLRRPGEALRPQLRWRGIEVLLGKFRFFFRLSYL